MNTFTNPDAGRQHLRSAYWLLALSLMIPAAALVSALDISFVFAHHHGQYQSMRVSFLVPVVLLPFVFRHSVKAGHRGCRSQGRRLLVLAALYGLVLAFTLVPYLAYALFAA